MPNLVLPAVQELIRTACCAPSVHNTQPWSWQVRDATTIELYADRTRQLSVTDPLGRDLALSCGAAVHHLLVAAPAFGMVAEVLLSPSSGDPDLLARFQLSPGEIDGHAEATLASLENRQTDRRAFNGWEVPTERLRHLCDAASAWGAHAFPVDDPDALHRAEELFEEARRVQASAPRIAEELQRWTDRLDPDPSDGISAENTTPTQPPSATHRPHRFERVPPSGQTEASEPSDTEPGTTGHLVAICTTDDDLRSWLMAGQTMSAFWLQATLTGLAATPVSQVIEVESTRRMLRRDVFARTGWPQILLRVGWPVASRQPLAHTQRRPFEDVVRA